jgi:hypothetical protein
MSPDERAQTEAMLEEVTIHEKSAAAARAEAATAHAEALRKKLADTEQKLADAEALIAKLQRGQ